MQIVLATTNKAKAREIAMVMPDWQIFNYTDFMGPMEIEENGATFAENSIIKATYIAAKLPNMFILADDSGLSVPILKNEPGIFSARYAGKGASDWQNIQKLCNNLTQLGAIKAQAFYTAAVTAVANRQLFTTHGFCYGEVINKPYGNNGFGYDPIFIPSNYDITFGQMDDAKKLALSHRSKALELMNIILKAQ